MAIEALMPLLLLPAKMLMEVQDLQPLAMRDTLPRAITFFLNQLSTRPFIAGDESNDEKFLVRAVLFLKNALSTSAYLPTRQAPPQNAIAPGTDFALDKQGYAWNVTVAPGVTSIGDGAFSGAVFCVSDYL